VRFLSTGRCLVIRARAALAALAVAAIAVFAVTACGGDDADQDAQGTGQGAAETSTDADTDRPAVPKKKVGYVTIFGDPVQLRFARVFREAAEAVGWEVLFVDAKGQPSQALRAMQNFINQNVDAIVSSSVETAFVGPALADARAKGIPTIATGAIIGGDPKAWSAIYVESEEDLSTVLAEHVVSQAPPGGKNHIGIIWNNEYLPGTLRYEHFKDALAESEWEVSAQRTVSATNPSQGSQNAASAMLAADPDISAILAIFDWMAPPAVTAIQAAGRDDVTVYSYYADHVNLPLLIRPNSPLKAVVDGNVEQVAAVAVDQLLRYFVLDEPLDPDAVSQIEFEYSVYTRDNAPEFGDDYLGPVSVESVVQPWLDKWNQEYAID
jgi:ABC-type sugar transport system substrate-binding protein